MFGFLVRRRFDKMCDRALKQRPPAFLKAYLQAPFPDFDSEASKAPILSMDLETNGLDVANDSILSIGTIALRDSGIDTSSAWHQVIRTDTELKGDVVPIHGLTHDIVADGTAIEAVLEAYFEKIRGHFLLAHHSAIEAGFLMRDIEKCFHIRLPFAFLDTLLLEQRWLRRRDEVASLRLGETRRRYGLPDYSAHNALTDALAAAELFLAEACHHYSGTPVQDLLTYHFPR